MPKWPLEKYIAWLEENLPFLHHSEMSTYKKNYDVYNLKISASSSFLISVFKKKWPIKLPMSCFFYLAISVFS